MLVFTLHIIINMPYSVPTATNKKVSLTANTLISEVS